MTGSYYAVNKYPNLDKTQIEFSREEKMETKRLTGKISSFNQNNGYGYISSPEHGEILVHSQSLNYGITKDMIKPEMTVRFRLDEARTGLVARFVSLVEDQEPSQETSNLLDIHQTNINSFQVINDTLQNDSVESVSTDLQVGNDFLSLALLYKEQKKWNKARSTYQVGMEKAASLELVLSFAAFEKAAGKINAAKEVYRKGIEIFPDSPKLHEDAGFLEFKQGDPKLAVKYFNIALELSPGFGGKANIQARLGILHLQSAISDCYKVEKWKLREAKKHFEKANKLRGLTHHELNLYYQTQAVSIKVKSALMFQVFEKSGFKIAQMHKPDTHYINFIVDPHNNELRTTYRLDESIFVRFLLITPNVAELSKIDEEVKKLSKFEQVDPNIAFLVTDRSAKPIMNALRRRLESGGRNVLIIPLELQSIRHKNNFSEYFRQLLNQWLFRRDLYQDNFPVSGSHFFGRERQLKSIFTYVGEGRHVGIFGLRKVGKTSFLWRVRDRSVTDLVAYVDLLAVPAAVKTCNYIYWLIGNELEADFKQKYPSSHRKIDFMLFGKYPEFLPLIDKPISLFFDSDLNKLRNSLITMDVNLSPKIVILIDEIERLLPIGELSNGFEGFFDFFSYWRGQAQHHRDLVTVITGANPTIAEQAQWGGFDNPVYKFYHEEFLPPLEYKECAEMLSVLGAGMGVTYTEKALEKIYLLTGGLPFISRLLGSRICQARPARPLKIDHRMVDEIVPKFMLESDSFFEEIIDRLERDFPLELIALEVIAKQKRISIQGLKDELGEGAETITRHLIGYQLVKESRGNFSIGLDLLRNYINTEK